MFKSIISLLSAVSAVNILDFGDATLGASPSSAQEFNNSRVLLEMFNIANAPDSTDRTVVIPKGAQLSIMPTVLDQMKNITFTIDGTLFVSENWKDYPNTDQTLLFSNADGITINGKGTFDGRGFMWWVRDIFQGQNECCRPHMLKFDLSRNIEMYGVFVTNGPRYHIVLHDSEEIYMHDFDIYVDVFGQLSISKFFGGIVEKSFAKYGDLSVEIPMFPLNTDAVDTWARNVTFRRMKITNFDDAIVPKPSNGKHKIAKCTENIWAEDIQSTFTLGMTLGSVPPNDNYACIRNVTFKNIQMDYPIKGIYIKPNPGNHGNGVIENVLYENLVMNTPIWWAIWIGPQQQHQPGGKLVGGCSMIYPFVPECQTQPRITMRNITLRNVTSTNSLLPAGVILCNVTNPCTNFNFDNVNMRTPFWDALGIGYINHFSEGIATNSFPDPKFKPAGFYSDPANRVDLEAHQDPTKWFTSDYLLKQIVKIASGMDYDELMKAENLIAEAQMALEFIQ